MRLELLILGVIMNVTLKELCKKTNLSPPVIRKRMKAANIKPVGVIVKKAPTPTSGGTINNKSKVYDLDAALKAIGA